MSMPRGYKFSLPIVKENFNKAWLLCDKLKIPVSRDFIENYLYFKSERDLMLFLRSWR
jgi:hypothetical protein